MSFSVVLLIGTVPSGQDSPESVHSWKLSETASVELWPFGLASGSCQNEVQLICFTNKDYMLQTCNVSDAHPQ